jgi:hypothetical protein
VRNQAIASVMANMTSLGGGDVTLALDSRTKEQWIVYIGKKYESDFI